MIFQLHLYARTHTHTHTHTHTLVRTLHTRDILFGPSTVNFRFQELFLHATVDIHFSNAFSSIGNSEHGSVFVYCMCVKFYYLTTDYPLPLPTSTIGHFFLYACLCDLLPNGRSLTIVDVHGWCVSTVIRQFY